jgi:maleylacetoacetate isomerase
MILHGYWRSSATYRVRIALAMKGVEVDYEPVNLRDGSQSQPAYTDKNPQGYLPMLKLDDGTQLIQSLAILDYLDATFSEPSLMPREPILRSKILAASMIIAADIHPIQNLSVLKYIRGEFEATDEDVTAWAQHWIVKGFTALETLAKDYDTPFLMTDRPMFFECCLIPQVYNAKRFDVDMSAFPKLSAINDACLAREDFQSAIPENQSDAPRS